MVSSPESRLVLTSEHGTAAVPARYEDLFRGAGELLTSHRAVDLGTAELTGHLARRTGVRPHRARVTRLLIDCNRSPGHPDLYSEFSRDLPAAEKRRLLEHYYQPYRDAVEGEVGALVAAGHTVLHVSVHSFTRVLDGRPRNADVGLLYDPRREPERALCLRWQSLLRADSGLRVRRNYPYRGVADGLATWLRRRFPEESYIGVELEVCQDIAIERGPRWQRLTRLLGDNLRTLLAGVTAAGEPAPEGI